MRDDIRALRQSAAMLTIISMFVIADLVRDLILPVMLGFLIALTRSPVNRSLQAIRLPAGVSATFLILMATAGITAVLYFAGETGRSWSEDAPRLARILQLKLSGMSDAISAVRDASAQVEEMTSSAEAGPQTVGVQQPRLLNTAVSVVAGKATSIGVALVLALFLLASGDLFYVKLVQAVPTSRENKRALATVDGIERRVSVCLLTITIKNASLGLVVALALWMLGLKYAYIWGISGALLAVPFLPVFKVLCENFPSLETTGNFLGAADQTEVSDPV